MAATITVSSLAGLYSALANAKGGETIKLAGGDYGTLTLSAKSGFDITFPSNVTITSANPLNPASFGGFTLAGVSNLTLDGVVCDYKAAPGTPTYAAPFTVTGGSNITISNSTFDGDLARKVSATADGYGTGYGLSISGTANLRVEGNEMFNFHRGMVVANSTNVSITGNDLHGLRSDGMDFAQVQGVVIEGNHIHDFRASPTSADHPDMIQFWTNGTTKPSTDIVIRGNVLDIGDGSAAQSIFMRNDRVDQGLSGTEMYYRNITIEENVITNAHLNGIVVGAATGLTIRQNTLLHSDGGNVDGADASVEIPQIAVAANATGVTITGNLTSAVAGWKGQTGWVVSNNALVQDQNPNAPGYYGDVFVSSTLTAHDGVHGFIALPGGMIDLLGAGAAATRSYLPPPGGVAAMFQVTEDHGGSVKTRIFDAGLSVDDLGRLPAGTTFKWTFGDGTSAVGQKVIHSFPVGGHYDVTLTVRLPNGVSNTTHADFGIQDRDILSLAADGSFVASEYGEILTLAKGAFASVEGIQLGSTGVAASVGRGHIADILRAEDFQISMRLDSDSKTSAGEVFRLHGVLLASVTTTGAVMIQATNSAGSVTTLTSTGVSVNDLKTHAVDLRLHDGVLQLWVDGKMSAQSAFTGTLSSYGNFDLTFGNPWGKTNFYGDITGFDIKVGENALVQDRSILTLGSDGRFHVTGDGQSITLPISKAIAVDGLQLGSAGVAASIAGDHLGDLIQAREFDIALRLDADVAGTTGHVFRLAGSITARVLATGELMVRAFDSAGHVTKLVSTGVVVNDTQAHDIDIRLHAGSLQLWIDGTVAAQTGFSGTLHDYGIHRLNFGNWLGETNFNGDLTAFDISVAQDTPSALAALGQHTDNAWANIL